MAELGKGFRVVNDYHLVLASNSPRRWELLSGLDIPFTVRVIEGVTEDYPLNIPPLEVAEYVAREKAEAYQPSADEIIITADTVVIVDDHVLGKPADDDEARLMLRQLSGKTHHVVTGVCMKGVSRLHYFRIVTDVTFKPLNESEIDYYVTNYHPIDKAGAYGIQEWIGYIGVTGISGSYFNVVGLPVQRIYAELIHWDKKERNV